MPPDPGGLLEPRHAPDPRPNLARHTFADEDGTLHFDFDRLAKTVAQGHLMRPPRQCPIRLKAGRWPAVLFARMAPSIVALADHEGFPAHANAIRRRLP